MKYFIAIGKLEVKGSKIRVIWDGLKSLKQAKKAKGNILAEIFHSETGIYWSYSVWESKDDAILYRDSGHHQAAMNNIVKLNATGGFHTFEAEKYPCFKEARILYEEMTKENIN